MYIYMVNYLTLIFNVKTLSKTNSMAKKHMEKCPMSLVTSEKQIRIPTKYNYRLTRMAKMIQHNNTKCWKVCGITATLIFSRWE